MIRLTISLREQERTALRALAEQEFRDPRAQAALIIRQELERRGLLPPEIPLGQTPAVNRVFPASGDGEEV